MSLEARIRKIERELVQQGRPLHTIITGSVAEGQRLAEEWRNKGYDVSLIIAQGVDFTAWPEPFHGADTVTTGFEVDDIQFPPDYHIDKGDATDGIEY